MLATYRKTAEDMLKRYEDDASMNALEFDRLQESLAVETFSDSITEAADEIMGDPPGTTMIESWDRVTSAMPGILGKIRAAVEADNR